MTITTVPTLSKSIQQHVVRYESSSEQTGKVLRKYTTPVPGYAIECDANAVASVETTTVRWHDKPATLPECGEVYRSFTRDGSTIVWKTGEYHIVCSADRRRELLSAILDYDRALREVEKIESLLGILEPQARLDIPYSYRIRNRDRRHWERIGLTMEKLAEWRLSYAQLEPFFHHPSADLTRIGKRLFRGLVIRSNMEDRLESLSDRMEALEDLYEGAVDRINDHQYWRDGHLMELIIIAFLAVECVMIGVDLYYRFKEGTGE